MTVNIFSPGGLGEAVTFEDRRALPLTSQVRANTLDKESSDEMVGKKVMELPGLSNLVVRTRAQGKAGTRD